MPDAHKGPSIAASASTPTLRLEPSSQSRHPVLPPDPANTSQGLTKRDKKQTSKQIVAHPGSCHISVSPTQKEALSKNSFLQVLANIGKHRRLKPENGPSSSSRSLGSRGASPQVSASAAIKCICSVKHAQCLKPMVLCSAGNCKWNKSAHFGEFVLLTWCVHAVCPSCGFPAQSA